MIRRQQDCNSKICQLQSQYSLQSLINIHNNPSFSTTATFCTARKDQEPPTQFLENQNGILARYGPNQRAKNPFGAPSRSKPQNSLEKEATFSMLLVDDGRYLAPAILSKRFDVGVVV